VKASPNGGSRLRFGQLELDLSQEKLLRRGLPVRLGNQPLQILTTLLEHPGEVVSREDLRARLWPDGTYVDFDEGLNTAIKTLRYALGDTADNPTFIETIPRRGYRFIAPVHADPVLPSEPPPSVGEQQSPPLVERRRSPIVLNSSPSKPRSRAAWLIALGLAVAGVCWLAYRLAFPPVPRVTQITRLTSTGHLEPWGGLASDGSRVFFLEREGGHWNTRQISVTGGESMPFGASGENTKIFAVSRDKSEILFAPFSSRGNDLPLWSMPLVGGAPRRVGNVLAASAVFSPDGDKIAFTNSHGVFRSNRDGSDRLQLAPSTGWAIDWSPDGRLLRFSVFGPAPGSHLWQVDSTGRNLHPFLPAWNASDGRWTNDGSYYIFTGNKDSQASLWAVRSSSVFPWMQAGPTQLTSPPVGYGCSLPSRDGHSLFACGALSDPIDVVRFDPSSHQFKPLLPATHLSEAAASPDGQWMLYTNWNQLWRSRPDGSDRLQLVGTPPVNNISVRWSPDSKQILFESPSDDNKSAVYLIPAAGGPPHQILPAGPSRRWPDWTPDGRSISFSVEADATGGPSAPAPGIYLLDLQNSSTTLIPGSSGLTQGRWSPDGRFFAAVSEDTSVIRLLDLKTHHWSDIAHGKLISFPVWSSDSVLYFQDILAPGEPVYRFRPGTAGVQRAYSFEDILLAGVMRCAFWGFAPDGSLLVQVNRGGGDIYALTVNLP
jgi:DNA-binding winged helix-turn-helix (wHTH) protein/Tol biopolymer transport system component